MRNFNAETILNLEKHNMNGYYVEKVDELHMLIKSFLQAEETIGRGDSVTLEDTHIFELLRQGNYIFI